MDFGVYNESSTEVLPAGERRLRLKGITQHETKPEYIELDDMGNPKNPYRWRWVWLVVKGANEGETFNIYTNAKIGPGSTAKPIVEALLGRALQNGERPQDTDVLEHEIDCYLSDRGEKGGIKNRIVDPKPVGGYFDGHVPAPTKDPTVGDLREYQNLRAQLLELGASREALNKKAEWSLGGKEFQAAKTEHQRNLLHVLRDWVENFETFTPDGDIPFLPEEAVGASGGKK